MLFIIHDVAVGTLKIDENVVLRVVKPPDLF